MESYHSWFNVISVYDVAASAIGRYVKGITMMLSR